MSALTNATLDIVEIPIGSSFPWSSFQVSLSGAYYTLTARYNTRMQRWILDIGDASGTPIVTGLPLLLGRNPLARFTYIPGIPPGIFFVQSLDGSDTQPTRYSWGQTHALYYYDPTGTT